MKIYKITKSFQGGMNIYYATIAKDMKIRESAWDYQLDEFGEATIGGHGYGYRIVVNKVRKIPENAKKLKFNPEYLEKSYKNKRSNTCQK